MRVTTRRFICSGSQRGSFWSAPAPQRKLNHTEEPDMTADNTSPVLTWITTAWPRVLQGRGVDDGAVRARNALLERYHEAAYRYFLRKTGDPHAAGELKSRFALRLLASDHLLKSADPTRGRFRDYLKKALYHMVVDWFREQKGARMMSLDQAQHDVLDKSTTTEEDFLSVWQQELLNQAWRGLEQMEKRTGQLQHTVLRYQADHPDVRAPQIAERLSQELGRPFTADGIRQTLHRARERFSEILLDEVARSLQEATLDDLEAELIDLRLLPYCQRALERRREAQRA